VFARGTSRALERATTASAAAGCVGGAVVAARAALASRTAVGGAADAWRAGDGAEDRKLQVGSA